MNGPLLESIFILLFYNLGISIQFQIMVEIFQLGPILTLAVTLFYHNLELNGDSKVIETLFKQQLTLRDSHLLVKFCIERWRYLFVRGCDHLLRSNRQWHPYRRR